MDYKEQCIQLIKACNLAIEILDDTRRKIIDDYMKECNDGKEAFDSRFFDEITNFIR